MQPGPGTSAAKRCVNSSCDITMWAVPPAVAGAGGRLIVPGVSLPDTHFRRSLESASRCYGPPPNRTP